MTVKTTNISHPNPDLTDLQGYFNQAKNRPRTRDIPHLNEILLTRARNGVRNSQDNNELLEFIGDRAVNLASALLIEKVKLSKAHHTAVRQIICNNDTFGRLAYYLKLDTHAILSAHDGELLDCWNPLCSYPPPKALADLFEAYAGAVYIEHGWRKLFVWMSSLLDPIVRHATADFWLSARAEQIFGVSARHVKALPSPETRTQGQLLDYISWKRQWLEDNGAEAVCSLPSGTQFVFDGNGRLRQPDSDRLEVAVHLINMWICRIVIQLWPEYHHARSKAAHVLSAITGLVISERIIAYLASSLSIPDYISEPATSQSGSSRTRPSNRTWLVAPTPVNLAVAFKATVGWFYHLDPERADAWGIYWLRPIVIRAHDIMVQEHGYKPLIPPSCKRDLVTQTWTSEPQSKSASDLDDDLVGSLVVLMGSVQLADTKRGIDDSRTSTFKSLSSGTEPQTCLDRNKWRPVGAVCPADLTIATTADEPNADAGVDDLTSLTTTLTGLSLNTEQESKVPLAPTKDSATNSSTSKISPSSHTASRADEKENVTVQAPRSAALPNRAPHTAPASMRALMNDSRRTPTESVAMRRPKNPGPIPSLPEKKTPLPAPSFGISEAAVRMKSDLYTPETTLSVGDGHAAAIVPSTAKADTLSVRHGQISAPGSSTSFLPRVLRTKVRASNARMPS